jgi:hypothetical protein
MDLDFNAEENAFRDEVRAFLKAHLPSEISTRPRILVRRRLVVPGLFRAGLGFRPRLAEDARRCARATSTSSTARRPGPRWASTPTGSSAWCAPTEGKPQTGISFLLIDMKSPGVTVRPIVLMDGEAEVNEVFFDNVEVPVANLVGEENKGWTYAKYLLAHERTNIAGIGASKRELQRLKQMAAARQLDGKPLDSRTPPFAPHRPGGDRPHRAGNHQPARDLCRSRTAAPGRGSSMLKIRGTEILQRIAELQVDAARCRCARDFDASATATMSRGEATRLSQPAQALDLRRIQRDPAQHHRPDDSQALGA